MVVLIGIEAADCVLTAELDLILLPSLSLLAGSRLSCRLLLIQEFLKVVKDAAVMLNLRIANHDAFVLANRLTELEPRMLAYLFNSGPISRLLCQHAINKVYHAGADEARYHVLAAEDFLVELGRIRVFKG